MANQLLKFLFLRFHKALSLQIKWKWLSSLFNPKKRSFFPVCEGLLIVTLHNVVIKQARHEMLYEMRLVFTKDPSRESDSPENDTSARETRAQVWLYKWEFFWFLNCDTFFLFLVVWLQVLFSCLEFLILRTCLWYREIQNVNKFCVFMIFLR